MTERTGAPKVRPLVAALLSLVVPGLGHIYLDRLVTGLGLVVAHVSLGSLATIAVVAGLSSVTGVVLAALPWCVLWVTAAVWAYRAGRAAASDPLPRRHHPTYLFALLALLALPNAAGWTLGIRANIAEVFRIPSRSMLPTIAPGARVLVDKLVYRHAPIRRGDLVVFTNPNARHTRYIKRVVALPGDIVELQNDELVVNGQHLDYLDAGANERVEIQGDARYRIRLGSTDGAKPAAAAFEPRKVPNGYCFVLGDNRHLSEDSRAYGPVPLTDVVGRVRWAF